LGHKKEFRLKREPFKRPEEGKPERARRRHASRHAVKYKGRETVSVTADARALIIERSAESK